MKMNEYQYAIDEYYPVDRSKIVIKTMENEKLIEAALGLAGESGETVDIIKKMVYYGKTGCGPDLLLELGDTLHYLCRICSIVGFDLEDVMKANIDKLDKRYGKNVGTGHEAQSS
jgi:NTP pyrophosphatase (non-canonical NTP hydrolase)